MLQRLAVHEQLPDVGDKDESLSSDTEIGVRQLNVPGQYQDQLVSWSEPVVVAHRTVQDLVEAYSPALKYFEPEDGQDGVGNHLQRVGCQGE